MSLPLQVRAVSFRQSTGFQIIPFPKQPRGPRPRALDEEALQSFSDYRYLLHVIAHLRELRQSQKLTIQDLAWRSKIPCVLISRAESKGEIPASSSFKAWVGGLGLSWEQVWSECLPSADQQTRKRVNSTSPKFLTA